MKFIIVEELEDGSTIVMNDKAYNSYEEASVECKLLVNEKKRNMTLSIKEKVKI